MGNLRGERLRGSIFAASRIKLRAIAKQLGVRHLVNLTGVHCVETILDLETG
jgi:hypothetical protein